MSNEKVPSSEPIGLSEKGFVFLDDKRRPYLCSLWGGKPWLFYWHEHQKSWVSLREVTFDEVRALPNNLTEAGQKFYNDLHDKFVEQYS